MLVATAELARRFDAIAADYLVARYSGPGNPMGAQVLRDGELVATKVPYLPMNPLMNRARGIETVAQLREVLAFYAATQQRCWIEVVPSTPVAVSNAMINAGFRVDSYGATLYAAPLPLSRTQLDVEVCEVCEVREVREVREIKSAGLDEFLDTLNTGFGTPGQLLPGMRANQSFWLQVPTWQLFIARVVGVAAGAAVLSLHADTGYLAAASTLPAFRNRGIQSALISARIARAEALGCTVVTGQAAHGSSSQGNMQRAGMQISHVRTAWTNQAIA